LLIKYNSDGLIDWATYYGGVNSEGFLAIGERSNGDLIVTGYSDTIGIPIVVFSPSGSPTYSGGIVLNSGAVSQDLWIDESNNVYITGSTGATDLHTPNAPQTINPECATNYKSRLGRLRNQTVKLIQFAMGHLFWRFQQ